MSTATEPGTAGKSRRRRRTTMSAVVQRWNSIVFRLKASLFGLIAVIVVGGASGIGALWTMKSEITRTLAAVQEDARLAASLTTTVSQELQAAAQYVGTRDPQSKEDFARLGLEAHGIQRQIGARPGQSVEELRVAASIEERLAEAEILFARAHRLADLGRAAEALEREGAARPVVRRLLADVEQLGQLKAGRVTAAADELQSKALTRTIGLVVAIVLGIVLAWFGGRNIIDSIYRPLRVLVEHARELSEGNLSVRTHEHMPGEFEMLAGAMNQTSESLSRLANVATQTADDVAQSAHDLASIADQISISSNHMAQAMGDITSGAETQVEQLRQVDDRARSIHEQVDGVVQSAREVDSLASDIASSAAAKQREIARAMAILGDVRETVQQAAAQVTQLNTTTEDITRFVGTVSRIAEQTNLLALNAAIEAARAGAAGRGFAVVADEVRKLAEQAQQAADEVVQMTGSITTRVATTTKAMQAGVQRVGEIEGLSRDVATALESITEAAERTRFAATEVRSLAEANTTLVQQISGGIGEIARTAESHAASAQEVSASTEEQSAACEQMSAASSQLLAGSAQLRTIVGGLRTQASGTYQTPVPIHTPLPAPAYSMMEEREKASR